MITLVCSFPRAGSSLMMRMLARGGMPIVGNPHSGETSLVHGLPRDWYWMKQCQGRCIKILDPQIWTPPRGFEYRILWMTRDHYQQALSQIKFIQTLAGITGIMPDGSDREVLEIERSLDRDELPVLKLLGTLGQCLTVRFEELLHDPARIAQEVNAFVGGHLCTYEMASEVVKRPTDCLPYMLELEQLGNYVH